MAKDTRLQKMLAECGIASRRKAEEMIAAGRVAVNGVRAQIGDKVDVKKDKVTVDGQRVQTMDEKVYIMVHKPRGYLTSMSDDRGRKCVSELVEELPVRLFPIGRLDKASEVYPSGDRKRIRCYHQGIRDHIHHRCTGYHVCRKRSQRCDIHYHRAVAGSYSYLLLPVLPNLQTDCIFRKENEPWRQAIV